MQRLLTGRLAFGGLFLGSIALSSLPAAAQGNVCNGLPGQDQLKTALVAANQLII
jgi:hypothetical protein